MNKQIKINTLVQGTLNSYSQVFFSDHRTFAIILLFISFIDPGAGLAGLYSVIISNLIAYRLGFNQLEIEKGLYGFNSLLVGLGIGYFFALSPELLVVITISSILTLLLVTFFKGILQKYGLPYLSIPFLFGIWTVLIASNYLETLGISQKGIYTLNSLYGLGGMKLISIYEILGNIHIEHSLKIFFTSIAAIFFQFSVVAGIILTIGLLIFSRIAFLLAVYGFYIAYIFYSLLGGNLSDLGYSYIGFNYILTAIAIGGFFIVPSKKSFLWLLVLIPVVTLLSLSLSKIFSVFNLSIYSLPFNIVVLLFIYALKFRVYPSESLQEVTYQLNSPEKNLYNWLNQKTKSSHPGQIKFKLPFHGLWTVSQAHDGEYTHKDEWRHAWDFVLKNEKEKEFENKGDYLHDYFSYGKSVLAPADGTVAEITDNIPDNDIGKMNLHHNWGNTIVIKHDEFLYSSLSHLKPGSIKVKEGDRVKTGIKIAELGNSGRSSFPHLHFQFQETPFIGSKTLDFPYSSYIQADRKNTFLFKTFEKPDVNDRIMNPEINHLLKEKLSFIPGQILTIKCTINRILEEFTWEVFTSSYNNSYLYDKKSNSFAWFVNDGDMICFTQFTGDKSSVLYYFYLGFYKVLFSWIKGLMLKDEIPQNKIFRFPLLPIQDFFSPFYLFIKSEYSLKYEEVDNELQTGNIKLTSELSQKAFHKEVSNYFFNISISKEKIEFKIKGRVEIDAEIS